MAALITVVPVAGYAVLAGAEVATVRSLVMILSALSARWLGYEQRIFHGLALAAGLILLHDPMAIYDISFQLSFLSVFAIAAWLSHPIVEDTMELQPVSHWRRWLRWAREAVLVGAMITVTTLPLVAYYFNQVPWLGLMTNVLAVPLMGMVLVPCSLLSAIGQLLEGGRELPFASSLQWLIDSFAIWLDLMAQIPGAEWHVAAPSLPLMGLFYVLLVWVWRGNRSPWRWVASAVATFVVAWWLWSPRLAVDGDHFRVTFLDVGQGDSAVVELPDGQVFLIDGGSTFERFDMGRGVVGPYLWNRGIRRLDHVIATHPQLDHVGGLAWILRHFPVGRYWSIGERREEAFYQRLQQALDRQGVVEKIAQEGMELAQSEACHMLVLNPMAETPSRELVTNRRKEGHAINNRSIVTRLTCGAHSILFAADVEAEALSRLLTAHPHHPAEVVKVPHHGAASSLQRDWIIDAHPTYAVFSAGKHNAYGHPAPSVIDAYAAVGSQVFRTDHDGGVWVVGAKSGSVLTLHRTADLTLRPISLFTCVWECERSNWGGIGEGWRQRW